MSFGPYTSKSNFPIAVPLQFREIAPLKRDNCSSPSFEPLEGRNDLIMDDDQIDTVINQRPVFQSDMLGMPSG